MQVLAHDARLPWRRPDPLDLDVLVKLCIPTGRDTRPLVASPIDILRIVGEFYGFHTTLQAADREHGRRIARPRQPVVPVERTTR